MALSWNEIKDRAVKFSKEWEDACREEADAKPFLVDFFDVFGITSKRVGSFEHKVKKLGDSDGYIDLLWKGMILIEMKSRGKSLDRAFQQAKDYIHGLSELEAPKYILVCDFENFRLYDLETLTPTLSQMGEGVKDFSTEQEKDLTPALSKNGEGVIEFKLHDLVQNVQHFGFIAGYQKRVYKEQDPVNIYAAEVMGKLHDKLKAIGYDGHPLEVYLVRLLFCLFADDTTIFDKDIFSDFIAQRTNPDGSDLAARLSELFYILNTPKERRLKNIDEQLDAFPYTNGSLFEETLPPAGFDSGMRTILLECCLIDWGKISPAIFGSMFQSVMNPKERRNLGAHYTSEKNILKLIKPLFLDELWAEFETVKGNRNRLTEFHTKLANLRFLDPACGCGNFLIITYRELRLLEMEIIKILYREELVTDVSQIIRIDVDQFYGVELEEFPARIAEVAMWLMDHQMNMLVSEQFGQYFTRLPLKKAANITHGNALRIDWETLVPKNQLSYILGNPPFIGSKMMTQEQRDDIVGLFNNSQGSGVLDYVSGWYIKAAKYIQGTNIKVAFVSTNSISQGEQVGVLWNSMFNLNIKIHFAHRTFKWSNEAKGNAAVYCVIYGFANFDIKNKRIFDYEDIKGEPHEILAQNVNPYIVDAKDVFIKPRSKTLCDVPQMSFGNMPNDGGNLLLTDEEKNHLISKEPDLINLIKPFISAREFINNEKRWCLWLLNANPSEIRKSAEVTKRINDVRKLRESSDRKTTKQLAEFPTLFGEIRQPSSDYILIPRHSSENRKYIPIGYFSASNIAADSCNTISNTTLYHFGILTSEMHMAWIKTVCGRIKSDYRYSNTIVYNNFPWPENPSEKQIQSIESAAQAVLDARAQFPDSSLADLYDPLTMPPVLVKAHNALDKAVDSAYRPQPFTSDAKRMEFLFELYEKFTSGLFVKEKKRRKA
ncbi:MAG: DNA methyltransferase [bacterium]